MNASDYSVSVRGAEIDLLIPMCLSSEFYVSFHDKEDWIQSSLSSICALEVWG